MEIKEPGHIYKLRFLDEMAFKDTPEGIERAIKYDDSKLLTFVNREEGHEHPGTQTQEVLRALIDRTYHCNNCMPDETNAFIIHHLRMALVYHEARALVRKVEKGELKPEMVRTGTDGHFALASLDPQPKQARMAEFVLKPEQRKRTNREY